MIEQNPFLKPKASRLNLNVNLPQERNLKREKATSVSAIEQKGTTSNNEIPFVPKLPRLFNNNNNDNEEEEEEDDDERESKRGSKRFGGRAAAAGMASLNQLPGIVSNLNTTPETKKAATGKVLSLASSGASIGLAAGGPWGAAAGAVVGAVGGILSNKNWKGKLVEKKDKALVEDLNENVAERQQNYFLNKTAEQIKSEMNIFKESQGILS
jgi:hypothetical protein